MLSFQKLITLVALMVSASQGAIAAPTSPKSVGDAVLESVGSIGGATVNALAPSEFTSASIKASGGTPADKDDSRGKDGGKRKDSGKRKDGGKRKGGKSKDDDFE